jgi:hypothetical protein
MKKRESRKKEAEKASRKIEQRKKNHPLQRIKGEKEK